MTTGFSEVVVLGGGVIGLSIARELARRGLKTTLIDRGRIDAEPAGGAATLASLGVLTAPTSGRSPFQRLQSWGHRTYPELARELLAETGIDIGYRVRGSLHLKPELPHAATRTKVERLYREAGLEARWVGGADLEAFAPGLLGRAGSCFPAALHISSEAVVHPPSLARALRASCERLGVKLLELAGEARLSGGSEEHIELAGGGRVSGGGIVLAAGSWSRLASLTNGFAGIPVRPVRGQAIEVSFEWPDCPNLRYDHPVLRREYHIVSKGNGLAWIGSTVEDAGFDCQVTPAGVTELVTAARQVLPGLREEDVLRSWAGLRPQALRPGGPFLGRLPGARNVWVASGHYRSGILTGPVSAKLLVRQMLGEDLDARESGLDEQALLAFRVER